MLVVLFYFLEKFNTMIYIILLLIISIITISNLDKFIQIYQRMNFSIEIPFNHSTKNFWFITLLPTIEFVVDKQMIEKFETEKGDIGGYIEYSVGFSWLIFLIYITLEYKVSE